MLSHTHARIPVMPEKEACGSAGGAEADRTRTSEQNPGSGAGPGSQLQGKEPNPLTHMVTWCGVR